MSGGQTTPAPARTIPTDRYIELLESHCAVVESRLRDAREALAAMHEMNKALSEKLAALQSAAPAAAES